MSRQQQVPLASEEVYEYQLCPRPRVADHARCQTTSCKHVVEQLLGPAGLLTVGGCPVGGSSRSCCTQAAPPKPLSAPARQTGP